DDDDTDVRDESIKMKWGGQREREIENREMKVL
ncbi:hypothetical protein L195_g063207, partial [Trifolium pratense]